jgi:hypothetical protein
VGVQAVPRLAICWMACSSSPKPCSTESMPTATSWPAFDKKAADAAEEQSPGRAANGAREAEHGAEECAKDHRRYEKWSADQ